MVLSPIVALIGVLALFVILDTIKPLLADIFIFLYFLFAFINIEGSTTLATFYLFSILFVISVRIAKSTFTISSEPIKQFGGISLKSKIPIFGILLGIGIFLLMRILQTSAPGAIIGVPQLAITSQAFNVTTVMLLGIVETRFFFTMFNLLTEFKDIFFKIPVLGQLFSIISFTIPIAFTSILFAIFHITAYSLSISTMVFAALVMVVWIISFILTKSDLPANISHALWNGIVSLGRALGIAI
tara:strand:- start:1182 stop:1910 length:729 start_codon:yes stop_codon:yes gene_type:complete